MRPDPPAHPILAVFARLALLVLVVAGAGALAASLVLPTAVAVTDVVDTVEADVFDVPPLPDAERPAEVSRVVAADNTELAEISFEERRIPVKLTQIPEIAQNAVIATEDATFWSHTGVNHQAILRAALTNASAGGTVQGGSTITQQYVKNAFLNADRTLNRKIKEAVYAVEIEKRLTKQEILERYLNLTYFGRGVYGIGTAANYYFGKPVEELQVGEAALLAGLIRSPETNNPETNPDNAGERRDVVLDQMVRQGFITQAQADQAKLPLVAEMLAISPSGAPQQPFFVDWVTRLLVNEPTAEGLGSQVDALQAMGATFEERRSLVFQGGLRIFTTVDPALQQMALESIQEYVNDPYNDPLAAITSVEPGSGRIVTMAVGPKAYGECTPEELQTDDAGRLECDRTKFNPVVPADAGSTRAGRQPGSAFKPFVISAALESGVPPGWQIDATGPQTIPGCDNGGPWEVNNSGGNGLRDMYSGIAGSSNVFHARLIKEIGPDKAAEVAARLGIRRSSLIAECSLALGAGEVFPLEMASAYATLANLGKYCAPYAIERIEDRDGNVLYQHTDTCEQVIDESIATRVVDIMKGPVSSGGTAPVANLGRWPTRGKTGTTQDYRDAWFVGYVRQMATAAWIGYENGTSRFATLEQAQAVCGAQVTEPACTETRFLTNANIGGATYERVFGGTIPAPMWKAYMARAVERFEPQGWPDPGPLPGATVPNVLNAGSIASAEERIERAKLNPITKTVEHYLPAGTIVGQDPSGGTRVPAGRAVIIEVSNGRAKPPTVPNVVGQDRDGAMSVLRNAGYGSRVITRDVNDPAKDGIVLAQSPAGGFRLPPDEGVVVILQVGVFKQPPPPPPPVVVSPQPPQPTETKKPKPKDDENAASPPGDTTTVAAANG